LAVTGLRVSEATGLKSEDIDWSEGVLKITSTKFLKSRLVPLHPSTLKQLRSYAKRRDRFFAERRDRFPVSLSRAVELHVAEAMSATTSGSCRGRSGCAHRAPNTARGSTICDTDSPS
jgi:integrase